MHFTLNQLKIYLEVVNQKSITKTAEFLHLSQPAISIQLKNFQDQFDIPLIEKLGKKIFITDFGYELAESAQKIINEIEGIQHKSAAYKGLISGKLKIAVVSTGKYVMPYFLSDFMKQHENVELIMDVTNKTAVLKSLQENQVDFALVSIIPKNLEIEKIDLLQNKLYLVRKNNLAAKKKNQIEDVLKENSLIFREAGSGTRLTMETYLSSKQIQVNKKLELTSNEAVKQAVVSGLGVSIMPLIGIKNELQSKQLQIIDIKDLPIKTMWQLIWLKEKQHNPVSEAFKQHLIQNKLKIIEDHFTWYESY